VFSCYRFENGSALDSMRVNVELDNLSVSRESVWGQPWAILVDVSVTLPLEPFTGLPPAPCL
jgi:hypothetical protein